MQRRLLGDEGAQAVLVLDQRLRREAPAEEERHEVGQQVGLARVQLLDVVLDALGGGGLHGGHAVVGGEHVEAQVAQAGVSLRLVRVRRVDEVRVDTRVHVLDHRAQQRRVVVVVAEVERERGAVILRGLLVSAAVEERRWHRGVEQF